MGTVVRDWRIASRSVRRRSSSRSRSAATAAEQSGHELHFTHETPVERHRLLGRIAVVVVPLLLLVVWVWWLGAERRAIRSMPAQERAELFETTIRGFEDLCTPPRTGLENHCRREASFLINFPECDDHCLSITRPILMWRS